MQEAIAVFIGIGLSATCGFRIFVPLLGMSIAQRSGYLNLSSGFEWVSSSPAMIALAVATVVEIGAYYIPWVDNVLDSIATPGAVIAGTLITASMVGDVSPFLRWSLAIIAGGGVAGLIQGSSVLVRATSTASTGGAGNPFVSTSELIAAIVGTIVSIILPVMAICLVVILITFILKRIFSRREHSAAGPG